jgi:hypothetical protein
MKARWLNLFLIAFIVLLTVPKAGAVVAAPSTAPRSQAIDPLLTTYVEGRMPGDVIVASGPPYTTYLPFVSRSI